MPAAVNTAPGGRTSGTKLGDAENAQKECAEIEVELMELKAMYEQYFLGQERRPPTVPHNALKKRMQALRNTFVNSTPVKFRIQNLQQRVQTFERLWERSLQEIEAGTYKRDVFKAKRHLEERKKKKQQGDGHDEFHIDEDLDLSDLDEGDDLDSAMAAAEQAVSKPAVAPSVAPAVAPAIPSIKPLVPNVTPGAGKPAVTPAGVPAITAQLPTGTNPALKPNPSAPRPPAVTGSTPAHKPGAAPPSKPQAPVGSDGGLNEQKIKAIYDAYLMAKKRCGEDTSKLSLDSVATTLRSQVPALMKQHNAKSVEFKVVIKDGKAVLRALPKE